MYSTFSGGSDYVPIESELIGTDIISLNVSTLEDDLVELSESFFVTGLVLGISAVPVTFGSRLEVTIETLQGKIKGRCYALHFVYKNNVHYVHVKYNVHTTMMMSLKSLLIWCFFGPPFLSHFY